MIIANVKKIISEFDLVSSEEKILVAVSGGADSVALLYALFDLGYQLEVAHFDHQTRQGQSKKDAEFVAQLSKKLGLPFHLKSRPVEEEAISFRRSFEEYAREVRYRFLLDIARLRGCQVIATGHHADDQVETVLMRMIRGTTPLGLTGIPIVRIEEGIRIIRPLYYCSKGMIETWLRDRGVDWCIDASNFQNDYFRNKVRNVLIPELRTYNQKIRDAILHLIELQQCESEYLSKQAEQAMQVIITSRKISRARFAEFHEAIRRRCLVILLQKMGIECTYERVISASQFILTGGTGQKFDLGQGYLLYNGKEWTEIVLQNSQKNDRQIVRLKIPGVTKAYGFLFNARIVMLPKNYDWKSYCKPNLQVFDADVLSDGVWVRKRENGDKFIPLGMANSRKLSDYFIDLGVPLPEREQIPILETPHGIIWIVGYAPSAIAAITTLTRRILEIEVTPCNSSDHH
ncbi:MAG TPA: tRNA lysidine(34) synthetase TilS [Candidatus Hydrogenedens sp.]|nr:tRNA lysidine(34) synthetase TilS [Candidatus Hydrogenedens sp.]HOL19722.1 tRNA lysidine(34) synthetase TilS [Candidatus Hydrogenedens sp.]HPP58745.1 tRNA lysidine(34) synthetase TilS [Candidatus Hydrogenedens sp.]